MSALNIPGRGTAGLARSRDRVGDRPLLGRKSVLMGMLTSGFVIANAAQPSARAAGTVKPSSIVATQTTYIAKWAPSTSYALGQQIVCPSNDVVSATVAHTSSTAYANDTAKWTLSPTFTKATTIGVMSGENLATALAAAPANSRVVLEKGATFDINAQITISANNVVIDAQGATLRIGSSPTGDTATLDAMLAFAGADQRIENAVFGPRKTGTNSTDDMARNVRFDGARGEVRNCIFTTGTWCAIRVFEGDGHRIVGNHITGSGVGYSWGGSNRTYVSGNTIDNAPGNALSGTGNGNVGVYNDDCWVVDNIINNCGRMGIEDTDNCRRTVIRGNRITGSVNIAVSIVSLGAIIEGNTIVDPADTQYGIEASCNGTIIRGNTITFNTVRTNGEAIVVNSNHGAMQSGVTITGNAIHNPYCGIGFVADITIASVTDNLITNPIQTGIDLSPGSANAINCTNNTIRFSTPSSVSSGSREGITTANCSALVVSGNTIAYTSASAGGTAYELPIHLTANTSVINGNLIDGGGRSDTKKPKMGSNGATPSGLVITSNQLTGGAVLDTSNMVAPFVSNNGKFVSGSKGNSVITSTTTNVVVTHGLMGTPTSVTLGKRTSEDIWVSARTATTFTVTRAGTSGALTFDWRAEV